MSGRKNMSKQASGTAICLELIKKRLLMLHLQEIKLDMLIIPVT